VAELVDAHDSKSCSARSGGSIPSTGTSASERPQDGLPRVPDSPIETRVGRGGGEIGGLMVVAVFYLLTIGGEEVTDDASA
jgi:hypothetical protein